MQRHWQTSSDVPFITTTARPLFLESPKTNMVTSLLELPPELLIRALSFLSILDLFKVSACSHRARTLAYASCHTLNLDFCAPPYQRDFYSTPYRMPFKQLSPGHDSSHSRNSSVTKHAQVRRTSVYRPGGSAWLKNESRHKMIILIEDAKSYDYETMINFHSALLRFIMRRHQKALQNLDISIWTITVPMAEVLPQLSALRSLSIMIQETVYARAAQRKNSVDQTVAWQVLAVSNAWNGGLRELRIDNADILEQQLFRLLEKHPQCQKLSINKCHAIGEALWEFLGEDWAGRATLRKLKISDFGACLSQAKLRMISNLKALQVQITQTDWCTRNPALANLIERVSIFMTAMGLTPTPSSTGTTGSGTSGTSYHQGSSLSQTTKYSKSTRTMGAKRKRVLQ